MGKPEIDDPSLSARLAERFSGISAFQRISEGEESRAYAFNASGGAFVARINASASGFEMDRMAHARFLGARLPVPEVLLLEQYGKQYWLCVSRRLPGDTLQALPAGDAYHYGAAMGQLLDTLTAVEMAGTTGAGPFNAQGETDFARWSDYVSAVSDWDWKALSRPQQSAALRIVDQVCATALDLPERSQLVHGDFGSNNVLVKDGAVSGLIDWSEAMIGDPLYDLANLFFWRPWLDCMEQQCRFIEKHEAWRLSDGSLLRCYMLRIGLQVLHDAHLDGDLRMADWALARCEQIRETG